MDELISRYQQVRRLTEEIVKPLSPEEVNIQTMPSVSPPKWHLAHTSWFFEKLVLSKAEKSFRPYDERYFFLFNSYYEGLGPRQKRPQRFMITRPTIDQVYDYRRNIDQRMFDLLGDVSAELLDLIELGLNHEEQHQELLLMDIKHIFACSPLRPSYLEKTKFNSSRSSYSIPPALMLDFAGGMFTLGVEENTWAFDNERPQHSVYVESFSLASRCVSNGEFLDFINDGGYKNFTFWHQDAWDLIQAGSLEAPLYWVKDDGSWYEHLLTGFVPLDLNLPVSNLSFYEAHAYAQWAGKRLPTESEWEFAFHSLYPDSSAEQLVLAAGNFLEDKLYQARAVPQTAEHENHPHDFLGNVWEWTNSAYLPYPGYKVPAGVIAEYNSKFMCNQFVLRGGSFASPRQHIRPTYRNFFYPADRWQMSGFRLAK